jgi:chaperone LolA
MKRLTITVVVIIITGLMAGMRSQSLELLDKLQQKYEKMNDAVFTFSQTTYLPLTKVTQRVDGIIRTKKTNKYRIETENELLVTDGETVWRMNKSKKQVLIDSYKEDPKNISPDHLFLNAHKEYNAVSIGGGRIDGKDISILKLTPKSESSTFKSIKLWINIYDLTIQKIETIDFSDARSTYGISKFSMDTGASDSVFIFTPPAGVEVIDLR